MLTGYADGGPVQGSGRRGGPTPNGARSAVLGSVYDHKWHAEVPSEISISGLVCARPMVGCKLSHRVSQEGFW